jgi:hypothetical protein
MLVKKLVMNLVNDKFEVQVYGKPIHKRIQ